MSDREIKKHESMGVIGISRVGCNAGFTFFGSDIKHNSWLELTIKAGELTTDLGKDWYSGRENYVTVRLTHAQFSELIGNMNCGDGVPCTVDRVMGTKMLPPEPIQRIDLFKEGFKDKIDAAAAKIDKAIANMEILVDSKGASQRAKKDMLSTLKHAKQDLEKDLPWIEKQFTKVMENTEADAKRNIEGHALNLILQDRQELVKIQDPGVEDWIQLE